MKRSDSSSRLQRLAVPAAARAGRRAILTRLPAVAALWSIAGTTRANTPFPARSVRIVVPYAAGGTTDLLAREVGQRLAERWGQSVVVDNRPGGGTVIGATAVVQAPADGHTLLLANNTHVISPHLMDKLPYDALRDFSPVATMATSAYLLLARPGLPVSSFSELLALARQQPGKLNFGTHGVGGLTHLGAELLNAQAESGSRWSSTRVRRLRSTASWVARWTCTSTRPRPRFPTSGPAS